MGFGQSAGPPASGRQIKDLLELLENAGHAGFRDARGPMGFNQRQAGGKFTTEEAAEFIDQLQTAEYEAAAAAGDVPEVTVAEEPSAAASPAASTAEPMTESERVIRTASTKSLVLEVRRRGWTVTKPKK
ncbi:MAG: hypothetical protein RIB98_04515 [Acidimicrobiales bacterium]